MAGAPAPLPPPPVGERSYSLAPHAYSDYSEDTPGTDRLINGLMMRMDNSNALLQQIVDETKTMATALHANFRYMRRAGSRGMVGGGGYYGQYGGGGYGAPGNVIPINPGIFGPGSGPGGGGGTPMEVAAARRDDASTTMASFESADPSETRQQRDQVPVGANPWAESLTNANAGYNIRQKIAQNVAQRLSNTQWGPQLVQDQSGMYHRPGSGEFASAAEVRSFGFRDKALRSMQNAFGEYAEGESLGGAIQGGLGQFGLGSVAKGFGYAGAAYVAANQVKNFANAQRAENAQFQRVLGGANTEGFGERLDQKMFSLSQNWFGGMGAEQANQLYLGAAEIYGRDRSARGLATTFGAENWRKFGMDVNESLALVTTAAHAGNASLTGLAQSLDNVTKSARDAGVSADSARKSFEAQYASATQTQQGPAIASVQGMLSTAQTNLGRDFTDVSLAGLNSVQNMHLMAAQAMSKGVVKSYSEFAAKMGEDPVFAGYAYQNFLQGQGSSANIIGNNPRAMAAARAGIAKMQGPNGQMSDASWEQLARDLEKQNLIDPTTASGLLTSLGVQGVTDANSVQFALRSQFDPTFQFGDKARQDQANLMPRSIGSQGGNLNDWLDPGSGGQHHGEAVTRNTAFQNLSPDMQQMIRDLHMESGPKNDTQRNYIRLVAQTGQRNPVIEQMLTANSFGGDTRYRVQVREKDGTVRNRYVTESQLISDYAGQAANAQIVSGTHAGDSVTRALGISDDFARSLGAETTSDAKQGSATAPKGSTDDSQSDPNSGTRGTIQIIPSPALEPWLRYLDAQGNPLDTSTSGVPSLPPGQKTGK